MAKAPTGISIKRSGATLSVEWKKGEKSYAAQKFEYRLGSGDWIPKTVGKGDTSTSITFPASSYHPSTKSQAAAVMVRIQGKKKKKWSAWTEKPFSFNIPAPPTITAAPSDSQANQCVFTWDVTTDDTSNEYFVDVYYETMLVESSDITDGSKLAWNSSQKGWQTGRSTSTTSYSVTVTETQSDISTGSHTRWFRVCSRGPAGDSAWRYAKRVYAMPHEASVGESTVTDTASGYIVHSKFVATSNAANPIEENIIQYSVGVPAAGLELPSGAQWTTAATSARMANSDAAAISVNEQLDEDECLWVRVNTKHLNQTTEGPAKLVKIGTLKSPTITNVSASSSTYRATITVAHTSSVPDSFTVVLFRMASKPDETAIIGVIPHGSTSITVQCPNWSGESGYAFGIYEAVGTYKQLSRADNVSSWSVDARMVSDGIVWNNGTVPSAPTNVVASKGKNEGSVYVTWDWAWTEAESAVISWADHDDAWISTDEPEDYTIDNLHAGEWTISGLETGKTWYIRVKLVSGDGDNATEGPWSDMVSIDLSSAPSIPQLQIQPGIITTDGSVSAYWQYVTTDGSGQAYAEICEATIDTNGITYGNIIAHTESAQHITIYAEDAGWSAGSTHWLCVRVVSASGKRSDTWSAPVPISVAEPLKAEIAETSLTDATVSVGSGTRIAHALTSMPLTLIVTGAGVGGTTTVAIERAEDYPMDRPDETDFNGFEGETIALIRQKGEAAITINRADLIGALDDGAKYRIVATVQDGLGQSDTVAEAFEVQWYHQAVIPTANVVIDGTIAKITPTAPETTYITDENGNVLTDNSGNRLKIWNHSTDAVDIYRLSADRPELVVKGAAFGTTYVDPYPAIGIYGGYRIVYRTVDGDYITSDGVMAWTDYGYDEGVALDIDYGLVDFDGIQIPIEYNMSLSNKWDKDFKQTKYLGGSVQGDWNKGVLRSGGVDAVTVYASDPETFRDIRRLAVYEGICHLRTPEGSSYACDIQVSDSIGYDSAGKINSISLTVNRVDSQDLDGMTLEEWEAGDDEVE